jgi:hypothetical protein
LPERSSTRPDRAHDSPPAEDLAAHQRFTQPFFDDLKPKGILEEQLVRSLADTSWRLNRIPALENNLLALGFSEHEDNIVTEDPESQTALVIAKALRVKTQAFAALSMYGERLSRPFEETLEQLRELQSERRQPRANKDLADSGFVFSNSDVGQVSRLRSDVPSAFRRPPN